MPFKVCFPFVGDTLGGSHISATLLASALPPSYYPHFVVHREGPLTEFLGEQEIEYSLLPLPEILGEGRGAASHLRAAVRTVPRVVQFLKQTDIGIVHSNDMRTNLTWSLPSRLLGIPQLWHQRVPCTDALLDRALLSLASKVVCISRFTQDTLPPRQKNKSLIIDNPFETQKARPDRQAARMHLLRELSCDDRTRVVAYCGNFMQRKRPVEFVEVLAKTRQIMNSESIVGVMYGETRGAFEQDVRRRAQSLGVSDDLYLMGFQHGSEQFLAAVDVLVATAVDEPFGRVPVEAMLAGTPVVASASGGHLESIQKGVTGLLIDPDDFDGMATAVSKILSEPQFTSRLIENAYRDSLRRYSLQVHAEKIGNLYNDLVHD